MAAAIIGIIPAALMIPAYYRPILGVENQKLQLQRIVSQSETTKTNRTPTDASLSKSGSVPQVIMPRAPAATIAPTILDASRQIALHDADEDYRINAAQGYRSYDRLFQRLPQELRTKVDRDTINRARAAYGQDQYDDAAHFMHDAIHSLL